MSETRLEAQHRKRIAQLLKTLRRRFALLFLFLLASIVVYPYAENSGAGYYAFRIIGAMVILLTVHAVAFNRALLVLVIVLAVPTVLQHVILPSHAEGIIPLLARVFSMGFDLVVIVLIFLHVFQTDRPDSETIFGALCIYLLIGFAFAGFYATIDHYHRNAFYLSPSLNLHTLPDRFDFIYYSFGTLTESGTQGISAVYPVARSLSLLEAIGGILYLAVLISRLLSAYRAEEMRREAARAERQA